jgi:hypothetical protein
MREAGSRPADREFRCRQQVLGREALLVLFRHAPGEALLMQESLNRAALEGLRFLHETQHDLSGWHENLERDERT